MQAPEQPVNASSTAKGDAFRDLVLSHLAAAGFDCTAEVRHSFKKADGQAIWTRDSFDGPIKYLVETKHYEGTLPLDQCAKFASQYGELVRRGEADRAWLISYGAISPDGREAIEGSAGLKCFTMAEFQRNLLNLDGYLRDLVALHSAKGIDRFYIRPHTEDGADLEGVVHQWISEELPPPLAVISGYGKGKSTFALHLAATMAAEALQNKTARVPILINLGDVMDVSGIDGLVGKVLTSTHRATNYHFHLFDELNRAGRFLVIFDGFDEMKHGMTITMFERGFAELMKVDQGDARVLILGRDTAFHNQDEFRSIISGRQRTAMGNVIPAPGRRECRPVTIREFTPHEVSSYVRAYFPLLLEASRSHGSSDAAWCQARVDELLGDQFSELIARPVHAQMLCQVATNPDVQLSGMTKLNLFDAFTHYLLDREVQKPGRDPSIPVEVRRGYNASVAWWLWEHGSATTVSLDAIPANLAAEAIGERDHDYDMVGLQRELAAGLLVEKSKSTVYFGHRSIQEFLVATYLLRRGLARDGDPAPVLKLLNPEIVDFLLSYFAEHPDARGQAREWVELINGIRGKIDSADLSLLVGLAQMLRLRESDFLKSRWMFWLGYLVYYGGESLYHYGKLSKHQMTPYLIRGWKEGPSPEAALLLTFIVLRFADPEFSRDVPSLLAVWLPVSELAEATQCAGRGKNSIAQVRKEDSFRLWSFLQAIDVEQRGGELFLWLSSERLHSVLDDVTPGLTDVTHVDSDPETPLGCTVQSLYRALSQDGVKDRDLELIRPFFADPQIRGRVRPLVVERRVKPLGAFAADGSRRTA